MLRIVLKNKRTILIFIFSHLVNWPDILGLPVSKLWRTKVMIPSSESCPEPSPL